MRTAAKLRAAVRTRVVEWAAAAAQAGVGGGEEAAAVGDSG